MASTLEYRRTLNGVIKTIYNSQKRHSILRKDKAPSYTEKELKEFLLNNTDFLLLFHNWKQNNYDTKLKPSVDRKDDYKSYKLNNLQVVTWDANRQKYFKDKINGINNKVNKAVIQLDLNGKYIKEYHSISEAFRKTGIKTGSISNCCKGRSKTSGGFIWKYKKEN